MILRLLLFGLIAVVGVSLAAWVLTRDRRYLAFAWKVVRAAVIVLLALGLMFVRERALTAV
ncbi:MAG: hypothetical protein ACK5TE_15170 [Pseudomonadota bacterium]